MNVSKVRTIERDVLDNFDILKGAMIYHYLKDEIAELTLVDNKIEILLEVGVELLDSWKKATPEMVAKSIKVFLNTRMNKDVEKGLTYGQVLSVMDEYYYEDIFEETLEMTEEILAHTIL